MVYFVQDVSGGNIKIGTTTRPSERVPQLGYQYKLSLRILGVRPGGVNEEQAIHRKFAHLNAANEWFLPDDELLRFIRDETVAWDGKDEARSLAIVKIDAESLAVAKKVAALKGMTLADYLSDVVMPHATKELQVEAKKISKGEKPE